MGSRVFREHSLARPLPDFARRILGHLPQNLQHIRSFWRSGFPHPAGTISLKPAQSSLIEGVPQAAASNKLTLGKYPA